MKAIRPMRNVVRRGWSVLLLALALYPVPEVLAEETLPTLYTPAREATYVLWYRNYDSPAIKALVHLAMEKTPEYGPFSIQRSSEMVQGRALLELSKGDSTVIDIAAVATSIEREKDLLAVPVPIDGGLLGFRVCVVMRDQLEQFEGVGSIADLRARGLRIGQGLHWPDSSILQVNGVDVVTHSRYETLFLMLKNQRFECFARGVSEVLFDLDLENDPELAIEPSLLLTYPMLSYFFVGPDDHATAHRLQLGMDRAVADGDFSEFLDSYYGAALQELQLEQRKILVLDNPYLGQDSAEIGRRALETLRSRISN